MHTSKLVALRHSEESKVTASMLFSRACRTYSRLKLYQLYCGMLVVACVQGYTKRGAKDFLPPSPRTADKAQSQRKAAAEKTTLTSAAFQHIRT